MEKEKKIPGRKSAYFEKVEPRFDEIRKWRVDEAQTEKNIAKLLGIGYATMKEYKAKYPAFMALLKESKENLLLILEKTLYQEAIGLNSQALIIEEVWELNARTGKKELVKETIKKNRNPNMTALIFALKNLAPEKWKDRRETETSQDMNIEESLKNSVDSLIETIKNDKGDK